MSYSPIAFSVTLSNEIHIELRGTHTHSHIYIYTVRCIHVYILVSTSYKKLFLHSFHKIAQPTTQTNTQMRQTVYVSSPLLFAPSSTPSPHTYTHSIPLKVHIALLTAREADRERENACECVRPAAAAMRVARLRQRPRPRQRQRWQPTRLRTIADIAINKKNQQPLLLAT